MKPLNRRLPVLAAALLLLGTTGCSIDYGYYRVDYAYGYGYECEPHYHTQWTVIEGHSSRYHAPCDGVRTIIRDACVPGYRYRGGPCP